MSDNHEMPSTVAISCLIEQRRVWKRSHPPGFVAKPSKRPDGSLNLLVWDCEIPGKAKTPWQGGKYKLKIHFSLNHPSRHPKCYFVDKVFHPNVNERDGFVCLDTLASSWSPQYSISFILLGIQQLLTEPNPQNPMNKIAAMLYSENEPQYEHRIRVFAASCSYDQVADDVEPIKSVTVVPEAI